MNGIEPTAATVAGYGLGGFAVNLLNAAVSTYLLYFYTDVVGIAPALAGAISFSVLAVAIGVDLWAAALIERTRSRWGRYRPYLFVGAPLYALATIGFYTAPAKSLGIWVVPVLVIAQLAFRAAQSVVSTAHGAMPARIANTTSARARLVAAGTVGALVAGLIGGAGTLALAGLVGGTIRHGLTVVAALFGAVSAIGLITAAVVVREPPFGPSAARPPLPRMVRMVVANPPLVRALTAWLLVLTGLFIYGETLLYTIKYDLRRPDLQPWIFAGGWLLTIVTVPVWMVAARDWGERRTWLIATVVSTTGYLSFVLAPPDLAWRVAGVLVCAFGLGAYQFLASAMLPKAIDWGERRDGARIEALAYGALNVVGKLGYAVAAGVLGLALNAIGYAANVPQSTATIGGLRLIFGLGPFAFTALSALVIWRYPLSGARVRPMTTMPA